MGEVVGFSVTGLLLGASEGLLDGFEVGTSVTGLLLGVSLGLFEGTDVGILLGLDVSIGAQGLIRSPS